MGKYAHLDRDALIRLLERRDAQRQLGLVWERDELDAETAVNDDFVILDQDETLSHGQAPWQNLIIEGDNYDALRAHEREFRQRLLQCFARAIENSGAAVPDEDELEDQLDLVLVRNPRLLRDARKRVRHADLRINAVKLTGEIGSDLPLQRAQRNVYGVFPPGLNPDERRVAELLDGHALVRWWHRNPSQKPGESVALYGWDDGDGFFPDFLVSVQGRETPGGIALLEVKGPQLWGFNKEPDKAEAVHPDYGRVFVTGHRRDQSDFWMLRKHNDKLDCANPFSIEQLRWA